MTVDSEILQAVNQMPEPLKQELLHYARYLIENYAQANGAQEILPRPKRRSGILQGTFVLPLSDDFDAPLEDFKDYME